MRVEEGEGSEEEEERRSVPWRRGPSLNSQEAGTPEADGERRCSESQYKRQEPSEKDQTHIPT